MLRYNCKPRRTPCPHSLCTHCPHSLSTPRLLLCLLQVQDSSYVIPLASLGEAEAMAAKAKDMKDKVTHTPLGDPCIRIGHRFA